jgi:hypothetical protein
VNPQAALLAKIAACGLNPDGIAIHYDAELQSDVISLSAASEVAEAHFECLWKTARGAIIEFADGGLGAKYDAFAEKRARAWMLSEAIGWLKAHNKFDGAPVYAAGDDLKAWAERVEGFCGMKPGEALELLGPRQMTMKPIDINGLTDPRRECLFYVLALSDLESAGVEFGFIGNEYGPESSK